MSNSDLKFASMVPLIGGESIGMSAALGGTAPQWLSSYPAFHGNDSHYVKYLQERKDWTGEYVVLEDAWNIPFDARTTKEGLNIVSSTCPCAGLSSFSAKPDATKNDYMLKSAEYVLEHVQPDVYWGENAPRLASKAGTHIRDALVEIARKYGYSCTFYKTAAMTHGVAQKRPRTFYFMWKSKTAPLMRDHVRPQRGLLDQISGEFRSDDPHQHEWLMTSDPMDDPWLLWALEETGMSYQELAATNPVSLIDKGGKWNKNFKPWENYMRMSEWMDKTGHGDERWVRRTKAMGEKLRDEKGGLWTHGITLVAPDVEAPAFIGAQPHGLLHPLQPRYLNLREMLRMMDMPEDFEMINAKKNFNHICQNVNARVAQDVSEDIVAWFNGELADSGEDYMIQENGKCDTENKTKAKSVEDFFA